MPRSHNEREQYQGKTFDTEDTAKCHPFFQFVDRMSISSRKRVGRRSGGKTRTGQLLQFNIRQWIRGGLLHVVFVLGGHDHAQHT